MCDDMIFDITKMVFSVIQSELKATHAAVVKQVSLEVKWLQTLAAFLDTVIVMHAA